MKILVAGDFVPNARIKQMTEKGDFRFFDEVKAITANADYSIVNFESPIVVGEAQPITKTGPNLKCHPNAILAIKYAGFKCVTLANNHFYDFGEVGVLDTLKSCRSNNIDYVGGGVNLSEAESILYKKIGDKTLAVINICENEWTIATETTGGSAPLNLIHNIRNIQSAKTRADYVLVIVHGGTEHYQLPSPRMKETYRFFIEQGADVVINHHQHCYSGYEIYMGKPIFYGLGNFCFDKNEPKNRIWNEGYSVKIEFKKNIIDYCILPYTQCAISPEVSFRDVPNGFKEKINLLNDIIQDDSRLKDEFQKMAKNKSFLQFFEPYSNKYLKVLKARGLMPTFINQSKRNSILEVFRCESHRDVMFELLQN